MSEQSREAVLAVLRQAGGGWVSGEELSQSLGVSRTAVWKLIEGLRAAGYVLEAQPRQGYRLLSSPDAVTPSEVLHGLATRTFGRRLEYRESVGSTNDLAKQLARAGAPEGLLVIADEQTAGKGRLGRAWTTPKGSALAMSLVLRPQLPPMQAPRITLVAAVAVAKAVREVTGLQAGIKWPNDLQLAGRKFCGILTEMEAEMERVGFVVCGMGINVNLPREALPDEFRATATSLRAEVGLPVARAPLVRAVMAQFESAYGDLIAGRFDGVLDAWRELSVTLGQPVRVLSVMGEPALEGTAEAVDEEGALLVRESASGKLRRVVAGEVTLRPATAPSPAR